MSQLDARIYKQLIDSGYYKTAECMKKEAKIDVDNNTEASLIELLSNENKSDARLYIIYILTPHK